LLGREPAVFPLDGEIRLFLDPDDYVHCMMFYDRYGQELLSVFRTYVRPGDVVIDVGAHIGYFSLVLGSLVGPTGHVYSFEPDPRALKFLNESVSASGMDWLSVLPIALAAGSGSLDFYLATGLGSSTAVRCDHVNVAQRTVVLKESLDRLLRDGTVSGAVRLVKIDIEGFEVEAIRGMVKLLRSSRPVMVVEVNDQMLNAQGESASNLFELLRSLDYKIEALEKPRRGKYSGSFLTRNVEDSVQRDGYYDVLCLPY
jgi:FkbM family methyltransferase